MSVDEIWNSDGIEKAQLKIRDQLRLSFTNAEPNRQVAIGGGVIYSRRWSQMSDRRLYPDRDAMCGWECVGENGRLWMKGWGWLVEEKFGADYYLSYVA